jgi:hypothetical protein
MRGHKEGDLVFFFKDGKAIGLDLYRDFIKDHRWLTMTPGQERVLHQDQLDPQYLIGSNS